MTDYLLFSKTLHKIDKKMNFFKSTNRNVIGKVLIEGKNKLKRFNSYIDKTLHIKTSKSQGNHSFHHTKLKSEKEQLLINPNKKEDSRNKNNIFHFNQLAKTLNQTFLPQVSPFIHIKEKKNDNTLLLDTAEANKLGSRGFTAMTKFGKLYNLIHHRNKNKQKIIDENDIFDENYNKKIYLSYEMKEILKRNDRIKNYNIKVNQKYYNYKAYLDKYIDNRRYAPKYQSIEKHTPNIFLNSNSKRLFPDNFLKRSYYREIVLIDDDNSVKKNQISLHKNISASNIYKKNTTQINFETKNVNTKKVLDSSLENNKSYFKTANTPFKNLK